MAEPRASTSCLPARRGRLAVSRARVHRPGQCERARVRDVRYHRICHAPNRVRPRGHETAAVRVESLVLGERPQGVLFVTSGKNGEAVQKRLTLAPEIGGAAFEPPSSVVVPRRPAEICEPILRTPTISVRAHLGTRVKHGSLTTIPISNAPYCVALVLPIHVPTASHVPSPEPPPHPRQPPRTP